MFSRTCPQGKARMLCCKPCRTQRVPPRLRILIACGGCCRPSSSLVEHSRLSLILFLVDLDWVLICRAAHDQPTITSNGLAHSARNGLALIASFSSTNAITFLPCFLPICSHFTEHMHPVKQMRPRPCKPCLRTNRRLGTEPHLWQCAIYCVVSRHTSIRCSVHVRFPSEAFSSDTLLSPQA